METADVIALVALVVAVASGIVSWRARVDAKRSADAAERSATADEAALAEQRREAQERRDAEAEAARPKPDLRVERPEQDDRYVLRNRGTGRATGVTITDAGPAGLARRLPVDVTLEPGQGHEFLLLGSWQTDRATEVWARWDGQDEPVALDVP
ncbi:hypothetical protein DMB38_12880 [Streptomyces sp. WAC 06738]|uniref:hypothetical protein n=1 Tax=Streptomyces sp. WAC 06738 TaxID=2203210 RepID=UPI000F6BBF62|nr:hypothetical protein [Streptomyces sp. WAC 06738]AZM46588.1 hypothetical protein DMB38_12880 [Streptomyces sp. WAC 06738]